MATKFYFREKMEKITELTSTARAISNSVLKYQDLIHEGTMGEGFDSQADMEKAFEKVDKVRKQLNAMGELIECVKNVSLIFKEVD